MFVITDPQGNRAFPFTFETFEGAWEFMMRPEHEGMGLGVTEVMRIHRVTIRMGEGEYGNALMEQAAREYAQANPNLENLVITVYEHGGWFLQWFVDGDNLVVVGTANDMARFQPEQEKVRAYLDNPDAQWVCLPDVRRP